MSTETQADFARRMEGVMGRQVARSTVKRWADKGRIVLDAGGWVEVEQSLALLAATKGGREDVARRHTEEAADKSAAFRPADPAKKPDSAKLAAFREDRAEAELRMAIAKADREEMERDKEAGRLIEKETVDFVLNDFGATLRGQMETLADRLAPVIFPLQTLEETHAALDQAAEAVLLEIEATLKRRQAEHE